MGCASGAPQRDAHHDARLVAPAHAGHTVTQLQLDESQQEGIKRPASSKQLLSHVGERPFVSDHRRDGRCLATGALRMVEGSRALIIWRANMRRSHRRDGVDAR